MTVADSKPRLIIIAGPTGVGKTDVAIQLALDCGGEIISADSMQVYRYMDIGTAKPSSAERLLVRHHLIDLVNPDESFSAALFVRNARKIIRELSILRRPVFVVGGTGLYIRALLGGLFDGPDANEGLRAFYRLEQARHGKTYLHEKLKKIDEKAARRIEPNDTVRIIRALEVFEASGQSITEKQEAHRFKERPYETMRIGLAWERDMLYERINRRADQMLLDGLIQEVRGLLDRGYDEGLKPMQALGYKHMVHYLEGSCPLQEALRLMKRDTRRYAKRQMTWFSTDRQMEWFSPGDRGVLRDRVGAFLSCRTAPSRSCGNLLT
jgi:tRNA dimethylallyltransferase